MRVRAYPSGSCIVLEPLCVETAQSIGRPTLGVSAFLDFLEQRPEVEVEPTGAVRPFLERQLEVAERIHGVGLMPFQEEGVGFLYGKKHAILADDMGLGKTAQALHAIEPRSQSLVVCPAFLRNVWVKECAQWRPDLAPIVVKGKLEAIPELDQLVIMSYESLPDDPTKLPRFTTRTPLIADEAQYLRNYTTRTRRFRKLSRWVNRTGFTWLLTGTPVTNDPSDLWALMQACGLGGSLYGGREGFDKAFNGIRTIEGYCWGTPKPDAMRPIQPYYLRRLKEDVLDQLPPKIHRTHDVVVRASEQEADAIAAAEFELDQTFWDLQSSNVSTARRVLSRLKIPHAEQVASLTDGPVIVFTCFRETAEHFAHRPGWAYVHGGIPASRRSKLVDKFQSGELRGLACTIQSIGLGVTLTRSHDVIFVDEAFTNAENMQAEDRVCRIGQDKPVTITRIVTQHRMDQRVNAILREKRRLAAPIDWPASTRNEALPVARLRALLEEWT
jgi:SWI/SNF-related matrix-associated actin-dependent regulator of chromatin subfamily A-like protein 1